MTTRPIKNEFLLDPDVVYLNHGAYGAVPKPVFESYQRWQLLSERQPVDFLSRHGTERLAVSRQALADYLGTQRDNLVYVQNGTIGLNIIAHNLHLQEDETLLTTDHEHGGINRMWRRFSALRKFEYRTVSFPTPMTTHREFVEIFWSAVTPDVKAIFISHITSPSALIFPVKEICARARAAGILTIVDGCHAPSQIPLNLEDIGADYYVGILHKWLCAPRGSAFLYVRPEMQTKAEPMVVSWGWEPKKPGPSRFVEYHEWQGSRDISSFLAVPDAIEFQRSHDWHSVRKRCTQLADQAQWALSEITGMSPYTNGGAEWFSQAVCVPIPEDIDDEEMRERIRHEHNIEVSIDTLNTKPRIRVSVQGYNDEDDIERLLVAVKKLLGKCRYTKNRKIAMT